MSEAHAINTAPAAEDAPPAFLSCQTVKGLDSLSPEDLTAPIVIFGDGELKESRSEECVARLRARGIKNPLVYYAPSRTVSPNERIRILDAGSDVVVDVDDVGGPEQDPNKDTVLLRLVRNLGITARQYAEARKGRSYEFGIAHDPDTVSFLVHGKRLNLSAYEYKILAAFFKLRGTSPEGTRVETAALIEAVYEDGFDGQRSNALGVHVRNINKELKPYGIRLRGRNASLASLGYAMERA